MAKNAARIQGSLTLESASFESSAQRARRVMREQMAGIQSDVSKTKLAMEGLTAGVGAFGRALAGTVLGAGAIATAGAAFRSALVGAAEAEQAATRFNAVLRATGGTAGVTARQVSVLADSMERTGTVTAEGVQDAASVLATFKNVSGEAFTRALTLSNDLAVAFKGNISSSALQLGKALESPTEGLSALTRVGVTFSTEQKNTIQALVDTGETAKAQGLILDTLAGQVGGVANAMGDTLTGAAARAQTALGNFLEALVTANIPGIGTSITEAGENALKNLAGKLDTATAYVSGQPLPGADTSRQAAIVALQRQIAAKKRELEAELAGPLGDSAPVREATAQLRQEIADLTAQQEALEKAIDDATAAAVRQSEALRNVVPTKRIPTFVSRDDNERTVLAAAQDLKDEQRGLADAQRDAKAAADEQTAALKRQGETVEHLTDAVAKLHAHYRSKPDPASFAGGPADQGQLTDRFRAERQSMEDREKYQDELDKERLAKDQRLADLQSDILIEPWRQMADEVAGIADDMFADLLDKGEISGKALGETFTKSINSTISSFASTLITQPLQKAVAEIGSGQYSSIGQYFSQNQNTLQGGFAGGAAGIAAGQVGGQVLGLDGKYSAIGGAAGAVAGGIIGTYVFPGLGTMGGAFIGGTLGSLAGGLIGGGQDLGNDKSAQVYGTRQRDIIYSDESFSQSNRSITSGILGEIETLQEALGDLGATFKDFQIRVEAGNDSGITVDGVEYDTAQDALAAAIGKLIGNRTGGLTETQQTILKSTKGETAAEIGQDLAFGEQYDRLTSTGNNFDTAIRDLQKSMEAARIEAAKLGLDVGKLDQAFAEGVAEINRQRDQATRGVYEQIAAFKGDNSLGTQLHGLETQMRELAKAAADLGIPLEEVTKAHQQAAQELRRVFDQNQRNVASQIAAARGDNSLGTQLFALETQMRELAKAAQEAGIPLSEVTKAHQQAAANLRFSFSQQTRGVQSQIAALGGDNSLKTQLFALETQFRDLTKAAHEAGLPIAQVTEAYKKAQENLRFQNEQEGRSLRGQIAALGGDNSIGAQLFELETRFRELSRAAKDAGIPVKDVTEAYRKAQEQLRFQAEQQTRGVRAQIAAFGGDNSLATQMFALTTQFRDLQQAAKDAGIPVGEVAAAFEKAKENLRFQAEQERRGLISRIGAFDGQSSLKEQLYDLDTQFRELKKAAQEAGLPLKDLEDAHRKAAENIRDTWAENLANLQRQQRDTQQSLLEARRGAVGVVDQYLSPIQQALGSQGIGRGVYAGTVTTASAVDEFRALLGMAREGDVSALSQLSGAGQAAVQAARETYGSGTQFAEIYKEIERGLQSERRQLGDRQEQLLKQLGEVQRETLEEQIELRIKAIGDVQRQLQDISKQLEKFGRDVVLAVEGGRSSYQTTRV